MTPSTVARVAAIAVLLAVAGARAGDAPRLDVPLGKTIEVDASALRGWMCDDPTLVRAELVTRGDHNVWRVTGAKLGTTACRIGTAPYGPHVVYEVHVVPAADAR
jgi:hypothetical protein